MEKSIYNMIGLAQKAGCIAAGETAVENAVKSGTVHLLIIASDASDSSRKHLRDMAVYRNIPNCVWGTKEDLGRSIGKAERSGVAVSNQGLALKIQAMIEKEEKQGE